VLALAAIGPVLGGYLGIAAMLALVTATASAGTFSPSGALVAAGPAWLAGYHVPLTIGGHELGILPLLPTALLLLLVGRTARNAADQLDLADPRSAISVIAPVAAAHAVFGTAIALLCTGPVTASPILAFVIAGSLAAVAATVGVARPCGLLAAALRRADHATETGLRAGVLAAVGLAAVGAVVFAVGLIASWSTAVALFRSAAPGFGSGIGMLLLCAGYLPNVLVGTLSFAAGPGFGMGAVTVAQWRFHAGPLPAVPLLAPVPATEGHWWVFLMLLPAGVGVLVGLSCRAVNDRFADRLRAVALAGLVAAVSWLVLAALAGGSLAGGPFDPVTVPAGALAASVFLLIAIPGALTVWLAARAPALLAPDDYDDGVDEPYEDEPYDGEYEADAVEDEAEPDADIPVETEPEVT
jgi:hypothetical protein